MLCRSALLPAIALRACHQKGNARIAFPPALMRVAESADHRRQKFRRRRFRHIPDLMRFVRAGIAESAQQKEFARDAVRCRIRQGAARTDAHHLRTGRRVRAVDRIGSGNMKQKFRSFDVGDIDDRCAVGFGNARQGIHRRAREISVVHDLPAVLVDDQWLVNGASLIVVVALDLHVPD